MSERLNRQLLRLTVLLQLEQRVRAAEDVHQLGLIFVNESHRLISYQQAAFWAGDGRAAGQVRAVSGVAVPDRHAAYVLWLRKLAQAIASGARGRELHAFAAEDVPGPLADAWAEWLPPAALWVPLAQPGGDGRLRGGLVFARAEAWREADLHLFGHLADAYAHAWEAKRHSKPRRTGAVAPWIKRAGLAAGAAALIALMFVPVRQSALAPAEVVADAPDLVRAPVEGVIDAIHVAPNEAVSAGQKLVSLDPRRLDSRIEVARKSLSVAEAEYRQAAQRAVFDPKARAELARLRGNFEETRTDLDYLSELRQRLEIRAQQAGIAVFDDPTDWLGKPVRIGERIMLLADPDKLELDMRLPIDGAIRLEPGAEVDLFLNLAPDRPVGARLRQAAYRANAGEDGTLAYRLKAGFTEDSPDLRLGLKGTAKIYGERVPLGFYLFRRPIGVVRTWLGL